MTIVNTGVISSDTYDNGNSGNVQVIVANALVINGQRQYDLTGISSQASGLTGNETGDASKLL